MVTGFWSTLVPNLFAKLAPGLTSRFLMSGLEENGALPHWDWHYLIPLIFGVLLLWRLMPKGGWISRWSLAFIVGITAGNRLITYLASDFIAQTQSTMKPLIVMSPAGAILWGDSFNNLVIVVGVITGLCYFYFSKEHTGWFGRLARVGIWSLMITFGAGFGYTVMGRVALLVGRMEFIFIDWLHLASR